MHILMHVYPYSLRVSDDNCLRHENDVMGGALKQSAFFWRTAVYLSIHFDTFENLAQLYLGQ